MEQFHYSIKNIKRLYDSTLKNIKRFVKVIK
jgi:hypothetical protein